MNSNGLAKRLIPSLLLKDGRLVKGTSFADWKDAGRPATTARAHNAQGADELIVLDIEASRQHRPPDYDTIKSIATECFMPITVGGGIRSLDIAKQCFTAGADKVCLTTSALHNPQIITELAMTFGQQAIVLGIDVVREKSGWKLFDFCKESTIDDISWQTWMSEGADRGAGEIRLMSVDREGSRDGMDIELLKTARTQVNIPIVLEGGAGTLVHLADALNNDADAVAAGTMLVFSDNNLVKIKRFLSSKNINMRV